jgi:hypothetical protein
MYDKPASLLPSSVPAGMAGVGTASVFGMDLVWSLLAVFALVAAGSAIMRIVPRNGER